MSECHGVVAYAVRECVRELELVVVVGGGSERTEC